MNQSIEILIGVIALILLVFVLNKKDKKQENKSELHAKDRYSVFDDDEHLTIFM